MKVQMKSGNGTVVIDGRTFSGCNIQINGNKVIVDGVPQGGELVGDITVTVHGDVDSMQLGSGVVKANSANSVVTGSGDVTCGDVSGSINTGSGDVTCGNVSGSVNTVSGDIRHR
ncbi:hypothetical protein [Photobacterium damselae]|uniref:hypothetical protein n=1 Tax=Photobacterium damselae TaxID=38293 RepID=UPI0040697EB8